MNFDLLPRCWRQGRTCSQVLFLVAGSSLLVGLLAGNGWSQIRGPQLGYVFDESQGMLRPILGVPGASRLGDSLSLGVSLTLAEISPKQDYALGVTQGDGKLVLVILGEGDQPSSVQTIESVGPGASHVSLSSEGKSAAVLFPESKSLRILRGLPDSPLLAGEIDLRLAGFPEALALDNEGKLVLLSVPEPQGSRISVYSRETGLQSLGIFGKVSALKLSADRQALVADRESHEVSLIHDLLGGAQRIRLAAREDGIHDPVAVAFSREERRVFVANAGSRSIASFSLDGGPTALTFCDCAPTTLERLNGDGVFRLTGLSEKPLLMFEASASENRILFVPLDNARRDRSLRERRADLPVTVRRSRLP
jgi:hypothetical protein